MSTTLAEIARAIEEYGRSIGILRRTEAEVVRESLRIREATALRELQAARRDLAEAGRKTKDAMTELQRAIPSQQAFENDAWRGATTLAVARRKRVRATTGASTALARDATLDIESAIEHIDASVPGLRLEPIQNMAREAQARIDWAAMAADAVVPQTHQFPKPGDTVYLRYSKLQLPYWKERERLVGTREMIRIPRNAVGVVELSNPEVSDTIRLRLAEPVPGTYAPGGRATYIETLDLFPEEVSLTQLELPLTRPTAPRPPVPALPVEIAEEVEIMRRRAPQPSPIPTPERLEPGMPTIAPPIAPVVLPPSAMPELRFRAGDRVVDRLTGRGGTVVQAPPIMREAPGTVRVRWDGQPNAVQVDVMHIERPPAPAAPRAIPTPPRPRPGRTWTPGELAMETETRVFVEVVRVEPGGVKVRYRSGAEGIVPAETLTLISTAPKPAVVSRPPKTPGEIHGVAGNVTTATGADVSREYEFRYRVMELDDVIASHHVPSATAPPIPNPRYPADLQPRERERIASGLQVERIARELAPDELLRDRNTLDRGPSIIGPDSVVESGNGRVMALNVARDRYPERWAAYQARLREIAPQYGIPVESLEGMRGPVLVRERITLVANRTEFARAANESPVLQSAPYESAVSDASRISDEAIGGLIVSESATLDQALVQVQNRGFVRGILDGVPVNERAALLDPAGDLNTLGLARIRAALFAKVYPGDAGKRLGRSFFESLDPDLKNVERAVLDSLPAMARVESLIRAGARSPEMSLTEDLSKAVDVMTRLSQRGEKVGDYFAQRTMFARELTPTQESILSTLDEMRRSAKRMRLYIEGYADAVLRADQPSQAMMFGARHTTKEEALGQALLGQGTFFAPAPEPVRAPAPARAPGYGREPAGRAPEAPGLLPLAGPYAGVR